MVSIEQFRQRAFTLIELSIVLVIIGLIIGGVIVGQDLIEAAKIRTEARAIERYNTAVNTFKLKYNCLPGDCANATSFWPAAATPYWTCAMLATPNVGDETCNGNGDGLVFGRNGADPNLGHSWFEQTRFWQQLSSAGLIQEKFIGVSGYNGATPIIEPSINVARSRVNAKASVIVRDALLFNDMTGNFYPVTIAGGNSYVIGTNTRYISGVLTDGVYYGEGPAYTTRQAQNFDTKFDDGKPSSGSITAAPSNQWNNGINCTTVANFQPNAQYNISFTGDIACPMYWKAQF